VRTVALVGGGHAHVELLRRFALDPLPGARLVVVLDRPVAVYSGMVPGFVAGDYAQHALEIDVAALARRAGASVIPAAALDLDPVRRRIALAGRPPLDYDLASLDVGSSVRDQGAPGVAAHALATRPIGRFVAEVDARLAALPVGARILVVGGGAAGCELAFCLEARLRRAGRPAAITLATREPAIGAGASTALRRRLEREARARGVALRLATRIVAVGADAARTDGGERIEADLCVWATGAAPGDFPRGGGPLARDADGFLNVHDTLQAVGFDDLFAAGDCARQVGAEWVPRAGVHAVRQGPLLARNLRARLEGRPLARHRPQRDFLTLIHLGDGRAIAAKWGMALCGRGARRLKDRIDRRFVARYRPDGA